MASVRAASRASSARSSSRRKAWRLVRLRTVRRHGRRPRGPEALDRRLRVPHRQAPVLRVVLVMGAGKLESRRGREEAGPTRAVATSRPRAGRNDPVLDEVDRVAARALAARGHGARCPARGRTSPGRSRASPRGESLGSQPRILPDRGAARPSAVQLRKKPQATWNGQPYPGSRGEFMAKIRAGAADALA